MDGTPRGWVPRAIQSSTGTLAPGSPPSACGRTQMLMGALAGRHHPFCARAHGPECAAAQRCLMPSCLSRFAGCSALASRAKAAEMLYTSKRIEPTVRALWCPRARGPNPNSTPYRFRLRNVRLTPLPKPIVCPQVASRWPCETEQTEWIGSPQSVLVEGRQ